MENTVRNNKMTSYKLLIVLLVCAVLVELVPFSYAMKSGFYVDNGIDQTVLDHELTKSEKREVESELLHVFGLNNKPKKKMRMPNSRMKKSTIKFLLEIYKSMLAEDEDKMPKSQVVQRFRRSSELNNIDQTDLLTSDAIMTFECLEDHVSGVRHERGKRLWFDVSDVPVEEEAINSELRIFQQPDRKREQLHNAGTKYTVTVYQVINSGHSENELERVAEAVTSADHEGWLELNMTTPLSTWVALPETNRGIYLSVHPVDKPGHEIKPEDIGLVILKGEPDKQPFLVGFFRSSTISKIRKPRNINRKKKSDYPPAYYSRNTETTHTSRSCQIRTLYVSFRDLEWQDWIIAPPGFEAFYCTGECNFPLNAHMNATNHAIVQTLVHLMNPFMVPKPCCAPTKLSPISVLYFRDESDVILKKYKNMVVKSCGCH